MQIYCVKEELFSALISSNIGRYLWSKITASALLLIIKLLISLLGKDLSKGIIVILAVVTAK